MDRRSFDLNYENNILFADPTLAGQLRARQERFIASSNPVTLEQVEAWPITDRIWNNAISMLAPVL